ncbi:MAG: hypothetical protein A3J10_02195 [Candidatus Sungbacteria bacterium RIFCSPLOWO2_02_FULL_54_10]|uniref:Uncharacterized protein n=2 Tax=Candidatus Sungiibacteriota TaxID=1817917 RepID=A0A1G2L4J3_9BACT|nr:MAG: hypothetical protein A2679_01945 [Candidatus Sungbacteria bacterium RIFCSPHIGHO2_01_FULL_54_26]OHA02843.1 MAG: hypothetical protein A3C92_01505 [Candidatus Sungbacteria bacterium RIFCSPHIGHO2_02_FULL_53_17]OHA06613.1 MAG: hypothetical protein A3B34_03860 [Candidatus Sungbacteria bacterium RIFCSPLOWO2_01_FULL_54_21]OHA12445.1 MAG: hypothetical protein A3J10_02195 [Candidatus Sungbacteria bacterium RIFCSPLOWO2_02_FULL_54_10]
MKKITAITTAILVAVLFAQLTLTSPATAPLLMRPIERLLGENTIEAGLAWIARLISESSDTEYDFTKTIDKYGFVQVALQYHRGVIADRLAEETSIRNDRGEHEMNIPAYNAGMKHLIHSLRAAWATTSTETLFMAYKAVEPRIVGTLLRHRVLFAIAHRDLVKMRAHLADPTHHMGAEDVEPDFSHKLIDRRLGEVRGATNSQAEVDAKLRLMREIVQSLITALEKHPSSY